MTSDREEKYPDSEGQSEMVNRAFVLEHEDEEETVTEAPGDDLETNRHSKEIVSGLIDILIADIIT